MARALAFVLFFFGCVAPTIAGDRLALVIANSEYRHVVSLKNPVSDADLIEQSLSRVGFEVLRYNNLDQRGMKSAMVEFRRKLKAGVEASVFYYAGHGVEVRGTNYLVPVDADTQSEEEADIQNVSVNSFLSLTENTNSPINIVFLDACRNNPFRSLRSSASGGLAAVKAPRGSYVAYSTSPGSVALDGEGTNSPFAIALADSIQRSGLTLEAVLKRTREIVQGATNGEQLPFDSSAITGEFYFAKDANSKSEVVASEPIPLPKVATTNDSSGAAALIAAGDDPEMLAIVVRKFGGSVWSELANEKLKKLRSKAVMKETASDEIVASTEPEKPAVDKNQFISQYRSYLSTWSLGNDVSIESIANYYAGRIDFYGKNVTSTELMAEKLKFATRWPFRKYLERDGTVEVSCNEVVCSVAAVVDWEVQSRSRNKTSIGVARLELGFDSSSMRIVLENGVVYSRSSGQ